MCFLPEPTNMFTPQNGQRKLSGDEFFLDWQKCSCAHAYGLLQVAFIFFSFSPGSNVALYFCFFSWATLPLIFIFIFIFWFSRPRRAFFFFFFPLSRCDFFFWTLFKKKKKIWVIVLFVLLFVTFFVLIRYHSLTRVYE